MDTITHGIVGALAGKAFFGGNDEPADIRSGARSTALSSPTAKAAIVACTLGSIFPDIDVFAGPLARNPLAIMEWHRNITHSLVMLPLWALLLAAVSQPLARRLRWETPPFAKLAGIYAVGLLSHVFLDVATSFGTMTWSPLNYSRVAWDWMFIIDFTFSAIALAPQLAAWCYRDPAKFARRAVITWIALSAGVLGVYGFAAASGFGFPMWVAGVASAKLAVLFFAPRIRGAGFRWKRANWSRAAMAVLCAVPGMRRLGSPEGARRNLRVCGLAPFAGAKCGRAAAAADLDALGWRGHHARRRVAHYIPPPERETGKHGTLRRSRLESICRGSENPARCASLSMVRAISGLAGAAGSRKYGGGSHRRAFLSAELPKLE